MSIKQPVRDAVLPVSHTGARPQSSGFTLLKHALLCSPPEPPPPPQQTAPLESALPLNRPASSEWEHTEREREWDSVEERSRQWVCSQRPTPGALTSLHCLQLSVWLAMTRCCSALLHCCFSFIPPSTLSFDSTSSHCRSTSVLLYLILAFTSVTVLLLGVTKSHFPPSLHLYCLFPPSFFFITSSIWHVLKTLKKDATGTFPSLY